MSLPDFQQQEKFFQLHECALILAQCFHTTYELAKENLFFGGYTMKHFVFKMIDGAFNFFVKPDINQIICFLENEMYDMCQAPETSHGVIGEKADVYSLGLIYREFLTFYT